MQSDHDITQLVLSPFEPGRRQLANWDRAMRAFAQASLEQLAAIGLGMLELVEGKLQGDWKTFDPLVHNLPSRVRQLRQEHGAFAETESVQFVHAMQRCYESGIRLAPTTAGLFLQAIVELQSPEAIDQVAQLLIDAPAQDWQCTAIGLSPLWKSDRGLARRLLENLAPDEISPAVLSVALDLSNFLKDQDADASHPWHQHAGLFIRLLSSLTSELEQLQRDPSAFGSDVEQVQARLDQSIALVTSLAHALAQIGDRSAIPTLEAMMELSHRRIQVEAAAALANFDHEAGQQRLIELAADPVARPWALSYAEEHGLQDKIDPKFTEPDARAESALATYLASPQAYGMAPHRLELIDTRELDWPGYEQPQRCWLFRFEYHLPSGETWGNVGFTGPLTTELDRSLSGLPPEDVYQALIQQEEKKLD